MEDDLAIRERILALIPQRPPFRFIDRIREITADRVVGAYRFRGDEFFYPGHFPGHPLTPGVILIETMAQTGVVALGIYLHLLETLRKGIPDGGKRQLTLFTSADGIEFYQPVAPKTDVVVCGTKIYYRLRTLQSRVEMFDAKGNTLCRGVISGKGVIVDET